MLEANSFAWTELCLTLPKKLTSRDAIAGPTTEVSAALERATARARSKGGRALAAQLQHEMAAAGTDRKVFVRIRPDTGQTGKRPAGK